ncbi:endonuclease/exonuclease/phosphatase family protein [Micromonospora fluostatini]|uniref:endonuclease/exonuclease/phosphatase family protein n=1 Tax=Micromonospora sp. JCM 30529 TaxID=3421643 RepID=UPI003D16A4D6
MLPRPDHPDVVRPIIRVRRPCAMRLRFATYNLLDLSLAPESAQEGERQRQVIQTIRAIKPDVIAVQELKCPPGRAGRLVAEVGERTGLTATVQESAGRAVHAVAVGDHTLHVALLWRPGLTPLPETFRTYSPAVHHHGGWRGVGYGSLVRLGFAVAGRAMTFASYHAPAFGRHRRLDQAETTLAAVTASAGPVLVGSDFNAVGAARVNGDFYDPDPYTGHLWWPDLVHQCHEPTHPGTNHRADRRPAAVWEAGGLYDVAAHTRRPWQATTGHWPSCPYSVRGIARRIDMVHATAPVLRAVSGVAVVDTPVSRAASDHLPVVVDLDPAALPAPTAVGGS